MIAYSYKANGEYIGLVECQIDPVRTIKTGKDAYLLPANATYTEPPEYNAETHIPVWDGESWTLSEIEVHEEYGETSTEGHNDESSVYDELAAAYKEGVQEA